MPGQMHSCFPTLSRTLDAGEPLSIAMTATVETIYDCSVYDDVEPEAGEVELEVDLFVFPRRRTASMSCHLRMMTSHH